MGKADPASTKPLTLVGAPPPRVALGSTQPLYTQIKEILRARILDGSYQPHQQMPSESEMMATFNVSRITVRQALNDLQNEGLIFRIHGKGTFVSKPKAFQDLGRLQGFGEAMRQMGYETFSRLLAIKSVTPSPQVAERRCSRVPCPPRSSPMPCACWAPTPGSWSRQAITRRRTTATRCMSATARRSSLRSMH